MPRDDTIQLVPVSFTCPRCKARDTHKLMYANNQATASTQCRCKQCEGSVILKYRIRKTKKGHWKLRVLSCSNDSHRYRHKRYLLTKIPHNGV